MVRLSALASLIWSALGCSYVEIPIPDSKAANGTSYVIGRTNELGLYGRSTYKIVAHKRGENGSKYGYVAVEGKCMVLPQYALDGMNEAGFTISVLALRESEYEAPEHTKNTTDALQIVPELLRNCGTVEDAISWLASHRVSGKSDGFGVHWSIADASGRSIVVEYLRGQRVVWENAPRVMTNDPQLDWHWRNLNTYVNLNPDFPHQNDFLGVETDVGTVPRAIGHGWNLAGLPGDTSPTSRYVQLFYLRGYALKSAPPKSADDAITLGTSLLNRVFIPHGTVAADDKNLLDRWEGGEFTPFAIIKIPSERKLLVRGYKNTRWRQVDLTKLDMTTASKVWPVEDGTLGIEDLTAQGDESHTVIL